ncbi:MAG: transketolase, partial [Alphaproteobacteria bacterium]|nr:transketolase [Alphaproteobacteria bacterium]
GLNVRVVSMPCADRFRMQTPAAQALVLGHPQIIASVEAGSTHGWDHYIHRGQKHGVAFGIDSYGASAPAVDLFPHFKLTPSCIAQTLINALA